METTAAVKQMFDFQKTIFNNNYDMMVIASDYTEQTISTSLDKMSWVNADSKKIVQDSIEMTKNGRENLKKFIDESFENFVEVIDSQSTDVPLPVKKAA